MNMEPDEQHTQLTYLRDHDAQLAHLRQQIRIGVVILTLLYILVIILLIHNALHTSRFADGAIVVLAVVFDVYLIRATLQMRH